MKVFILSTVMAPYRIDVFNELGKLCNLVVCFEQKKDQTRNDKWYQENAQNFKMIKAKGWEKSLNHIKFSVIKYLKEEKPDFVIFYEYSTITSMMLMQYCIMHKIKYLINCDGAFINEKSKIKEIIKKYYIKKATGCLANGNSAQKYFLHYGAKKENIFLHKFSTLYEKDILKYPPTLEKKREIREELNIDKTKKVFICVGNFIYRKGYDLIIDAAKKFKNQNILFINIGGGNKKAEYENESRKYNLKNIIFEDFKDKETLKKYYDMSNVCIFPTREDIWGLVINEAMSRGLPVITTDRCNAGIELIEDGKNGKIIKAGSCEELINGVKGYLEKTDEELLKEGIESLSKIKNYTIEGIAKSHISVLEQLDKE